jgi:hypothetical protein
MAYPRAEGLDVSQPIEIQDETINLHVQPGTLVHCDLHAENALVGEINLNHPEHWLFPIVKVCTLHPVVSQVNAKY